MDHTNNPGSVAEGRGSAQIAEQMRQSVNGSGVPSFLVKVVVEEVLFDPTIIDDDRANHFVQTLDLADTSFLRSLPPNTIIGRPLKDGTTSGTEKSQYFFPFFPPHMMFPVKAGEHVWVFFEANKDNRYGYWWFRVTEPRHVDDLNYTHPDRKFQGASSKGARDTFEDKESDDPPGFANSPIRKIGGKPIAQAVGTSYGTDEKAYEKLLKESDAAKVHDFEEVPRFKKRPADYAIQGSNNTRIVLGTDRTGAALETETKPDKGKVAKGKPTKDKKGKAGSIDIVVGAGQGDKTKPKDVQTNTLGNKETNKSLKKENPNEGDPDFETDMGRFYLSMKTDADKNFNIKLKGISAEEVGEGEAAGIIKVDHVRIIARKTIKFLVQPKFDSSEGDCAGIVIKANGDIVFVPSTAGIVKLGGDDADKAVLCFDQGAANGGGTVAAPPMMSTMGGFLGLGGAHGIFATKIMAK